MEEPLTESRVDEITDLFQAFQLLNKLKINPSGIKDLETAKCRLLQYLKDNYGAGEHRHINAADLMREVLDKDRKQREQLAELYKEAEVYIGRLPAARHRELEKCIPNIGQTLTHNITSLRKSDCAILIAGEVSAGKSSLLNLILGEELLPTSLLSCTSVICELAYSTNKYALVHPWDSNKPTLRVDLSDNKGVDAILSPYIHQKGSRLGQFTHKRVQIFWPFELLKGGMVIVDSPGIGESREMTRMVKEYLPAAFAFVYVINSGNAGGLQPDRLQDLLAELTRYTDEDMRVFEPRSALFVCNKWDQVPLDECYHVMVDTKTKLRRCWRGIEEDQVFTLSTTKAMKSIRESGYVTQDFAKLLEGIESLFPVSLRCKLETHYRWLSRLLRRSAFYLRAYIANETRSDEQRKELTEYLHNQLDRLETEARRVIDELQLDVERRTNEARDNLIDHLGNPITKERLASWDETDCPEGEDWDVLQEVLVSKVNKRIRREVNEWDNKNSVFAEIQAEMIQRFQEEFELMEDQLGIIEGGMVGKGQVVKTTDSYAAIRAMKLEAVQPMLTRNQKIALGVAAPLLLPLGVVVGLFALPVAGVRALRQKLDDMRLLKNYKENKTETMAVMSEEILTGFTDKNGLSKLIRDQMNNVTTNADALLQSIPLLIEADRLLIQKLQEERTKSEVSIAEEYLPQYFRCVQLLGKLDLFHVHEVRTYEFKQENIKWDPASQPFSASTFGDVYRVTVKEESRTMQACIKVRNERLNADNITEILMEQEYLRKMNHENVVSYHGSCGWRSTENASLKILFVLEPCLHTLRDFCTGREAKNPAKYGDNVILLRGAKKQFVNLSKQVAKGLAFLHEKGMVHRNLTPQTVLVTDKDVVKLTDIGLTKTEGDVSDGIYPVSPYSAPEVIEGREYSKAADVHSLGFVMWELWYGMTIEEEIASHNAGKYVIAIRAGLRPTLSRSHEAPENFKDLMTLCWEPNVKQRPAAAECVQFFDNLEHIPGSG